MKRILLDSNVVIYFLKKDPQTIAFLEKFIDHLFVISIITWIEVLAGSYHHEKTITEMSGHLASFIQIPLDFAIGLKTAELIQEKNRKKRHFRDSAIAAAALVHDIPLITNNPKDFRHIKGLKLIPIKSFIA